MNRICPKPTVLLLSLLLTACGGGGGDSNDGTSGGNATHGIRITETFNLDAGQTALQRQYFESLSNGDGIGQIQTGSGSTPQPGNAYRIDGIDVVNSTDSSIERSIDFAAQGLGINASAAQLAAYLEQRSSQLDVSASTQVRLTLSNSALTFDDFLSINGTTVTGATRDDIMAAIDRLPNITARINSGGDIFVTDTQGNDLRIDLDRADVNDTGATATITSYLTRDDTTIDVDSVTIGDNQPYTRATVGGVLQVVLDYPFQLANATASNVFASAIAHSYHESDLFAVGDPDTYNHAYSTTISDNLAFTHVLTQYFVRLNSLGGTQANRWRLYVLIDGRHVGTPDGDGEPAPASFDIAFDSNGQLDTARTDDIVINAWRPLDDNGNANGAATTRISIDIGGSTQFAGAFSMQNIAVN